MNNLCNQIAHWISYKLIRSYQTPSVIHLRASSQTASAAVELELVWSEVWEITVELQNMLLFWWLMEADGASVCQRKWAARSKWDSLKLNAQVWLAGHTAHWCHVTLWPESDKKREWMWSKRTVEMCKVCVCSLSHLREHIYWQNTHFIALLRLIYIYQQFVSCILKIRWHTHWFSPQN